MVALLLYVYAIGERSSRRIERRCVEDVATRVICATRRPVTPRSRVFASATRSRWLGCSARCSRCAPKPAWCRGDDRRRRHQGPRQRLAARHP
ncbi:MAG: hypothetical protein M3P48_08045 [Actinomycetota bacterium]|nr:hypothetical protein [Actinomycetota bacterium]